MNRTWRGKHLNLRREWGQALPEFALVIPVLILILMGVFDFGRAFYAYSAISNGAREGARYGVINPTSRDADGLPPYEPDTIEGRAVAQGFALDPNEFDVDVATPTGTDQGDPLTVTVRFNFRAATPIIDVIWGGGPLTLRAEATMLIECPDGDCFTGL